MWSMRVGGFCSQRFACFVLASSSSCVIRVCEFCITLISYRFPYEFRLLHDASSKHWATAWRLHFDPCRREISDFRDCRSVIHLLTKKSQCRPPSKYTMKSGEQDAPSNRKEPPCLPAFMITTTSTPRSTLALAPSGG